MSSVMPLTLLLYAQQYQQSRLHLYSTNKYAVIGWKSPGSTRDRTYGKSQPRILRYTSGHFQSRLSGIVSGPGSDCFSGYCGKIGSGRVIPLGTGGFTSAGAECIRRLWMSTSMRNFGAVAMLIFLHRSRVCLV